MGKLHCQALPALVLSYDKLTLRSFLPQQQMLDHVSTFTRSTVREAQKQALLQELRAKGIKNEVVLQAIAAVRREDFLPEALKARAYENVSLPIGAGQTISQPYTVAFMTELLAPAREQLSMYKVLEIGTGSGYQAAILAAMGIRHIFTVERIPELFAETEKRFAALGIQAQMRLSDGTLGWSEKSPFDAIIVTAGSPDVPEALAQQLAVGGTMVVPVGSQTSQRLYRITRVHAASGADAFQAEEFQTFRFVPLLGEQGWSA